MRIPGLLALLALSTACSSSTGSEDQLRCPDILPESETCGRFCDRVIVDCAGFPGLGRTACVQNCECDLRDDAEISEECVEADEAYFTCVAGLDSCLAVEDHFTRTPEDDFPCKDALEDSMTTCGF